MDIILIGAGGCMRELVWQIQEQNKSEKKWNILGYTDSVEQRVLVGKQTIPYLGTDDALIQTQTPLNVVITIGNPKLREQIYRKLSVNSKINFPNLVLNDEAQCEDVKMGKGCIISKGVKISTNVMLGDFVFINMDATICHDTKIEDFVTLSPAVRLAGNVRIGQFSDVGMGALVIQGRCIGSNVILGAGSVVVKNIESDCTAVGIPACRLGR